MNRLLAYLILLITVSTFVGCSGVTIDEANIIESNSEVDSLRIVNVSITQERDSLLDELKILDREVNYWFNQEYDGDNFNDKGINDPKEYLLDALDKNRELIPMEGILGGTMHFGKLEILSSEWLIVDYDDGHIIGKAIFEYHFGEKDEVTFKLIKSIENE